MQAIPPRPRKPNARTRARAPAALPPCCAGELMQLPGMAATCVCESVPAGSLPRCTPSDLKAGSAALADKLSWRRIPGLDVTLLFFVLACCGLKIGNADVSPPFVLIKRKGPS